MRDVANPLNRTGLEQVSLGLAGAMTGVSFTTLLGWWLHLDEFLQPFGELTAMPLNAALGFASLGVALLAIEAGRRAGVATASLALVLGGLTMFQHLAGRDLGIDEAFGSARHLATTAFPGRPSVATALLLMAASLVLLWRLNHRAARLRAQAEAGVGSVLAATGLSTLFAHGTDLPDVYAWGSSVPTSPTSAVALVILGCALVALAWRENVNEDGNAPAWSPLPVVVVCLSITVVLWIGLRQREQTDLAESTQDRMERRSLPEVALAAGFGITVLLGMSVHFARRAQVGQRAAESSSEQLRAENEERRRIEGRLKVSDDRLRLALDSTQIGIFEWSVASGHVYYSPALWAMLGYDHGRMPSTIEAWQSLIHPDDLQAYRRRTEAQLRGIASFIEPEYRVRTRSGDWRWVYTRAKSVATGADGRPSRIVGTVQDITARREAELALRESQSAARKLSLVAAKTDNPVLISSADGRIEWANEAFCRVMEYRLEEVVGRNPVHFMVGPDTDPETLACIRAAMEHGSGISTDVVNYSKSGRKFHLHVEIQPVRGADGSIEHFVAVETDITARVETELQLRRAKAEADETSRAKSEFLATMSHEIRTPMNGVIGMTSLLMATPLNREQRDCVSTIRTSGEALLTIINDILDFSKVESGKMELERAPFDLSLCLEEALDLFALQASAKRIELGYHIAADVPGSLLGDATRLRQVVVNLVNNAIKFTPGGSVSVEVRRTPATRSTAAATPLAAPDPDSLSLEFTVRDTGIGIPPDRLDRLFRPFSQVDSSTTRKYGGTGLGLAISQRLCGLMGGDIRVESGPAGGTAFIFTILTTVATGTSESGLATTPLALRGGWILCVEDHPVTQARLRTLCETWRVDCVVVPTAAAALTTAHLRAQPPALVVVDAGDAMHSTSPLNALASLGCPMMALYLFGQTPPVAPAGCNQFGSTTKPLRTISFMLGVAALFQSSDRYRAAASTGADRPLGDEVPLEVLVAEDNAVNQKVALRFLERLGYRADTVANGLEAVTTLEHRRYDLVLMDLQMPEMDGFEATRQIRRRLPAHRQPKIIALTANAMQGDREQCCAAGMDDHISKPMKMDEIAETIRRHFPRPEFATTATESAG